MVPGPQVCEITTQVQISFLLRLLMSCTVIFSLMGLLFVAIQKSGFEPIALGGAHPVLGLITLLLVCSTKVCLDDLVPC